MIEKILYGPGDWLGARFTVRQRRALAAWVMILTIFPGIPFTYLWKNSVWMVWLLSIIALTFAAWGVLAAETPVEKEELTE